MHGRNANFSVTGSFDARLELPRVLFIAKRIYRFLLCTHPCTHRFLVVLELLTYYQHLRSVGCVTIAVDQFSYESVTLAVTGDGPVDMARMPIAWRLCLKRCMWTVKKRRSSFCKNTTFFCRLIVEPTRSKWRGNSPLSRGARGQVSYMQML